nr:MULTISPECIES: hypothetical protein [unclassified Microbispora]
MVLTVPKAEFVHVLERDHRCDQRQKRDTRDRHTPDASRSQGETGFHNRSPLVE